MQGIFYFVPMPMVCFNGDFVPADQALFTAANSGFKYGDGVFETMRLSEGRLLLSELHFERLFSGLQLLQIHSSRLSRQLVEKEIGELCERNSCIRAARIRLAVYRESDSCGYIIEASPLAEAAYPWSEKGYAIDIFPQVRKATDAFSNLKSANYLPYVMAYRYATKQDLDEAIILNANGAVCDGSKTNLFLIKDNQIITPALSEGCVDGVMRRYLLQKLKPVMEVFETSVSIEDLQRADAIFLTNALRGICWVKSFRGRQYEAAPVKEIYDLVF